MNSKEKVLLHKGMDKVKAKEYEKAMEIFEKVIASNHDIPEAWNNMGVALYGQGKIDEAIECYNKSLALDPGNLDALRNKAFLLRSQMRLEEALQIYDTVLENGGDAIDQESTAIVLVALGRLEEALNCLYIAREKLPMDRLEKEIEIVQNKIQERDGQKAETEMSNKGEMEGDGQ